MSTYTVINPATATPVKDIELADLATADRHNSKGQQGI